MPYLGIWMIDKNRLGTGCNTSIKVFTAYVHYIGECKISPIDLVRKQIFYLKVTIKSKRA